MTPPGRAVIVGGGMGGRSIACHLALPGCRDVVVDRAELGSGSTLPAARVVPGTRAAVELSGALAPAAVERDTLHDPRGEKVRA